jgi:hypothetical protein
LTDTTPDWLDYEHEVHAEIAVKYRDAAVRHDVKVPGHISGVERQIDVLIEEPPSAPTIRIAVDAKYYSRDINVKDVETFIGLLHDVRVDRGMMLTNRGYTPAALTRAYRDDVDLDLDVLTLDEFKQWQSEIAIPYAAQHGVVIPAPIAWVVDGKRRPGTLARLYRRGFTFDEALTHNEFMYVNIWIRRPPVDTLERLLAKQETDILKNFPDAAIHIVDFAARPGATTCLRRVEIPAYPSAELTAFAEFPSFILFIALFTPLVVERRNLRKLEYVLMNCIPAKITHAA